MSRYPAIAVNTVLLLLLPALPSVCAAEDLDGRVGVGVAEMPAFPGSDSSHARVFPVADLDLHDPHFYIGGRYGGGALQAGVRTEQRYWTLGAGVSYATLAPREASPDAELQGLPQIDRTAWAGAFVAYDRHGFHAGLRWDSDVLGHGQGDTVTLDIRQSMPLSARIVLSLGPRVVWGDDEHMRTYFGITPQTAAATGLAVYTASSGMQEYSFGVGLRFQASPSWMLGAEMRAARLSSGLEGSPVLETRNQATGMLVVTRLF